MLAQLVESLAIQFSTEMTEQDPNCSMSNFIYSLFIIILIDETIELCINKFVKNKDTGERFPNLLFREVLSLATKTCVISENNYRSCNGASLRDYLSLCILISSFLFASKIVFGL